MKQYRTAEEIKKYDIFKVITFLILVILLFLAWSFLRPQTNPPVVAQATTEPTATQSPTQPTATTAPTRTPSPSATPSPTRTPLPSATPSPTATVAPTATPSPSATPKPTATATSTRTPSPSATPSPSPTVTIEPSPTLVASEVNLPTGQIMPGQVALTGTGQPGSEVEIVINGQVVGKATVGSDGAWSFNANLPESGDYQIGVQNVDADGQVIASAKPVTLTVIAPTPTVTAPTLNPPGEELTTGALTLTGTGEPGSKIEVVVDGQVVGTATVGDDGTWRLATELSQAGDHEIAIQSVGADGQVLAAAEPIKLVAAEKAIPPTLDLPKSIVAAGPVTLNGTGKPGSEVEIVVDGKVVGKAIVGSDGTWSFTIKLTAQPKAYQISTQVVDAAGKVLAASKPVALRVVAPPTLDRPDGKLTTGPVTLTGTGEPGSKIEVVVAGRVVGTATVGDDGKWSFSTEVSQAGDYEVMVRSVDPKGQILAASKSLKLPVAEAEKGQAYVVQLDDWLSKLSLKFYNDVLAYPVIVEATNAKAKKDSSFTEITNPDLIEVGQKLWIPDVAP